MALNSEQAEQIKQQLFKQLDSIPIEQREPIKKQIEDMSPEQLEAFLKQQQKLQEQQTKTPNKKQKSECIFCQIGNKTINSFAIYEDEKYIAPLEIHPFSKGHIILIPKKHIKETKSLPTKALTLANKIGKHLIKQLKAKTFQVTTAADMHHAIINIIPEYKEPITFQRKEINEKELQELAIKIGEVPKRKKRTTNIKTEKKQSKEIKEPLKINLLKFERRIP